MIKLALVALSLIPIAALNASDLYVAPTGDDSNPGTKAKPFATLERARDAVRQSKIGNPKSNMEVFVRAGTYELTKTFKLAAEDSGSEKAPVVYRAYPKEKVLLIGGKRITGFVPHKGQILKTDVGAQGFTNYFRQLFLDGKRMQLARYPNYDAVNPNGGFAYVDGPLPKDSDKYKEKPEYRPRQICYKPSDARSWAHPELAEVIYFPWHNWLNISVPVTSVDKEQRLITLTRDVKTHAGYPGGVRPGDRYFVRNLFEELDSAGEWFLDREKRTLYFWPPKPLAGLEVYAPTKDSLIEIGAKAEWITIRGFTMECCDGYAVSLRGASNCLVAGNTIRNTAGGRLGGGGGVFVDGGANCGVVGNDIYDVGNIAITLRGGDRETLTPAGHYADNNYLHHIGVLNAHGHGVMMGGIGLRVSHNLMHDITRSGIFGGGNDCVVEYNHIRHDNLMTEDTAGYYNGGNWHNRGQIVRYNYVHDTLGYGRRGGKWVTPLFAWGIYFDDDESGTHAYGNIVARVPLGGFHVHAGRDNIVENNIIIDCEKQQFQMSGHDPVHSQWLIDKKKEEFAKFQKNPAYAKYPAVPALDLEKAWLMVGNKFRNNIISYQGTNSMLYTYSQDRCPEQNETDHNLVWHHDQPITVQHSTGWKSAKLSWEEWQKAGHDQHSTVADPLFVNAAKDDYRLAKNSPAFKLGFKPIPVEKIGPYKDPLRASWPIVEAEGVREHPQPIEMGPLWPDKAPIGDGTFETTNATVTVYLPAPAKANGAAVVICPGGGYQRHVTWNEGDPIARWLTEHGIAGIVLEYRLPQGRPFVSLLDAQRAIRTVRSKAAQWNLDPKRIGIIGFSAGGHLASTAGTHFDDGDPKAADPVARVSCRPDFTLLVYPVVTMGELTHGGSKKNLLGPDPKPELVQLFSNEKQVTDKTPPTFLTHAIDDKAVPVENSRQLVEALKSHNIPVNYLELPNGGHGLNGCKGPLWEEWKAKSLEWLAAQGFTMHGNPPRAAKSP
ncbi:MAG: right-handed parallel beta-helix repeat-containing protein [Verrucomicrobiia bacterium]|jgi:acetyl esterase/lipase